MLLLKSIGQLLATHSRVTLLLGPFDFSRYCSAEVSAPLACAIALRTAGVSAIALSITKSWIVPM